MTAIYEKSYTHSDARMRSYDTINCLVYSKIMNCACCAKFEGRCRKSTSFTFSATRNIFGIFQLLGSQHNVPRIVKDFSHQLQLHYSVSISMSFLYTLYFVYIPAPS
jgi:hypothetical protein